MADSVRAVARGLGELLLTLGIVVLLFCVYELKITNLYTAQEQEALADELRSAWAAAPDPAPRPGSDAGTPSPSPSPSPSPATTAGATASPAPGSATPAATGGPATTPAATGAPRAVPVAGPPPPEVAIGEGMAVLRVPRLGRDHADVVVEGVTVAALKRGPGHYPGTALPGQVGNVVISGHRTTYGAPFEDLDRLRPGDALVLETRDSWFTYRMTDTLVVSPTAVEQVAPVPGKPGERPTRRLLTLTTCHPKFSARQRLIVRAELEAALPKSTRRVPPALAQA